MLDFLSLCGMFSILLYILVCVAAGLFCACLVSVQVSAPYVIACSTHEVYTCLFRQVARLLLKISRCLAHADQPAMILRCRPYIFVLVLFPDVVVLSQVHVALIILFQHIVHVYSGVVYNHQRFCLCVVHLKTDSPTSIG